MKKLMLFMLLVVALGLITACGRGNDAQQGEGEPTENQTQDAPVATEPPATPAEEQVEPDTSEGINWEEHITFTWFMNATPANDFYTSFNDNPVVHYLQHRFNVTFEFEQAPVGTESDHLALMMGAGRHTDVINLAPYVGSIPQLYYDGIIVDIAQWLDYMPYLRSALESRPDWARGAFDDSGRILTLPDFNYGTVYPWSGLMYRHDILETMTEGNVQFPSGNDVPTTIADWEYMLPLFLEFFQEAGFADFAPLILPAGPMGVFHFGELMNSFGAYYMFYVRDGVVYAGMLEPAMFEYVSTMRDWFERGWIHQDFASRTTDMFFMPNPPLVFGGAAGAWFGMMMHMGDRMSMPEFGMYFDVRAMPSPMGEGITHRDMLRRREGPYGAVRANAVYAGNPDIGRFLAIMDIFYSEHGGRLRTLGLTAEQIPPGTVMEAMDMMDGAYWFDANGNVVLNPLLDDAGGPISRGAVNGIRLPGIQAIVYPNAARSDEMMLAHTQWGAHDDATEVHPLPSVLTPTLEEAAILAANEARFTDFIDQTMATFIMGTAPLNEETWEDFLAQLRDFGFEENREIWQAAYDRYLGRVG